MQKQGVRNVGGTNRVCQNMREKQGLKMTCCARNEVCKILGLQKDFNFELAITLAKIQYIYVLWHKVMLTLSLSQVDI